MARADSWSTGPLPGRGPPCPRDLLRRKAPPPEWLQVMEHHGPGRPPAGTHAPAHHRPGQPDPPRGTGIRGQQDRLQRLGLRGGDAAGRPGTAAPDRPGRPQRRPDVFHLDRRARVRRAAPGQQQRQQPGERIRRHLRLQSLLARARGTGPGGAFSRRVRGPLHNLQQRRPRQPRF